jgi:hypothetical protein
MGCGRQAAEGRRSAERRPSSQSAPPPLPACGGIGAQDDAGYRAGALLDGIDQAIGAISAAAVAVAGAAYGRPRGHAAAHRRSPL